MPEVPAELVAQAGDPYLNLLLEHYPSEADPVAGAVRPAAVLFDSSSGFSAVEPAQELVLALLRAFGHGRLIWAAAERDGELRWEFYVYNGIDDHPAVSLAALRKACADQLSWMEGLDDQSVTGNPVSFDVDDGSIARGLPIDHLNAYINAGPSAALSYRLTPQGAELANFYRRYRRDRYDDALRAVDTMVHLTARDVTNAAAPSSFREIHLAQKRSCDGVYWVGVPVGEVTRLIDEALPGGVLSAALRTHAGVLGHVLFDIGLDAVAGHDRWSKVAVYGVL